MSDLEQIRADTEWYLTQWPESLLRRRAIVTYDAEGKASQAWDASLSFTGDFQTLTGAEMEAEAGLEQRSDYKCVTVHDADIIHDDRVERGGGTFRVNYTRDYEDHKNVFVAREVQQP